jgi:hypothetical protein
MCPAALSHGVDVLHFLHSDWQTVSSLAAEIRAPDGEALPAGDLGILLIRLCARLYALSRIETELLYPCVDDQALRDSGNRMHDQMVVDLHAVLDAMMREEHAGPADGTVQVLMQDLAALHRFEVDMIFPCCDPAELDAIGEQMMRKRLALLDNLRES